MMHSIDYDIGALTIAAVIMVYYFYFPKLKGRQNALFSILGVLVISCAVFHIAGTVFLSTNKPYPATVFFTLYQLFIHALPLLMAFYLLETTGKLQKLKRIFIVFVMLPYAAAFVYIAFNPITGCAYTIQNGCFIAGSLWPLLFASVIFYLFLGVAAVKTAEKGFPAGPTFVFYIITGIIFFAFYFQYGGRSHNYFGFVASVSLLLLYLSFQSSSEITDSLTRAYNIHAFTRLLAEHIDRKRHFFVFAYSIDDFRRVNEIYGKDNGDTLLKSVARTLSALGVVARVYGSDFYVLIKDYSSADEILRFAENLPNTCGDTCYTIPFDATKVVVPGMHFDSPDSLMGFLTFALDTAKSRGDGTAFTANKGHIQKYRRNLFVKDAVARAVKQNGIDVAYQPIVDAYTGKVVAAEALARLTDPTLGVITPVEFIGVAEQSGLILELGRCVRKKVWKLLSEYDVRRAGINHISVNLSAIECVQKSVMDEIIKETAAFGVDPSSVAFEVTETAAVASKAALAYNINMMKSAGFEFHLDDYGTGYASMTSLISLPFSIIKLDRSMIKLAMAPRRGDFVKRTIDPLHSYGIQVVTEGIETEAQAEIARSWGVDYLQGYLYSEPLFTDAFVKFAGLTKIKPTKCKKEQ